jgi:hypothetical protein
LYLGSAEFESQPEHQLMWLRFFMVLLSPTTQILG